MASEKLNYKSIGKSILDGLIPNERGNFNGEDVINALLKASGGVAGKRIKSRREELRMNQEDLAEVLKRGQSEIAKIENGTRAISVEDAKTLAKILKTSPEWILTGK